MQDPDHLVECLAIDRVARVGRLDHRGQRLLGREVDRKGDHLRPRHHHGRDLLVGEIEDLVEHLLLLLLELALIGRALEQHLQLGLRVDVDLAARRPKPERPQDRSLDRCRTQISGLKTMKNPRTGVDTASAVRSEYSRATPFGTSSPTTTWRNVMIKKREVTARNVANTGSKTRRAPVRRAHRSPGSSPSRRAASPR